MIVLEHNLNGHNLKTLHFCLRYVLEMVDLFFKYLPYVNRHKKIVLTSFYVLKNVSLMSKASIKTFIVFKA